jgi:hypothetical protein
MIRLVLSPSDVQLALAVAFERNEVAVAGGWRTKFDEQRNALWKHELGALGEVAVARWMGLEHWRPGVNTFHAPDIAPDIQVRARSCPIWDLMLRTDDPTEHRYVLTYVDLPAVVTLVGWCGGAEHRTPERWGSPNVGEPCWWIPYSDLNPMETFDVARR